MDHPTQRLDPDAAENLSDSATRRFELSEDSTEHTCPKCSGEMIWAAATSGTPGVNNVKVFRRKRVQRWTGAEFGMSRCSVLVCVICGFIEWYATAPKDLLPEK